MLLRNLDQQHGLCNWTRLIIKKWESLCLRGTYCLKVMLETR